jgi:hypothetical protein
VITNSEIQLISVVLTFISSLAWPAVVIFAVWHFRIQIAQVLLNIIYIKTPFCDFEFQQQDSHAIKLVKAIATQEKYIDSRGFYTRDGLSQLITKSGFVQEEEKIFDMLLLFDTPKQHTWIVSTNRQLFCILDDENTRSSRSMIQWKMPLNEAEPIRARASAKGNPVVDIGQRKSWLYSRLLYPSEEILEKSINRLIEISNDTSIES